MIELIFVVSSVLVRVITIGLDSPLESHTCFTSRAAYSTVCIVKPRMLLSAIIIMVLRLVNIVDNYHDNK